MNAAVMRFLIVYQSNLIHDPSIEQVIGTLLQGGAAVQMIGSDEDVALHLNSGWFHLVIACLERSEDQTAHRITAKAAEAGIPLLIVEPDHLTALPAWFLGGGYATGRSPHNNLAADVYPAASVVLADLVDFTHLASHTEPSVLLSWLNRLFQAFDRIVARHGLTRIKTIGDAYMAAAGVPAPMHDHARAAALAALEMRQVVKTLPPLNGKPNALRIGLSSGSLFGGMANHTDGYDVWGDAVNAASRLQQTARPNAIHVAESTHDLAADRFRWYSRGKSTLKGIGPMQTYYLLGPHQALHKAVVSLTDGRFL